MQGNNIYLESTPVRSNNSLSPLHESLLVPHDVANFDDIARHRVVQDFHGLTYRDTPGKKFDHVTGFKDDVWIVCLSGGPY